MTAIPTLSWAAVPSTFLATEAEVLFQRYHYNFRNLYAIELKSVLDWQKKLLTIG